MAWERGPGGWPGVRPLPCPVRCSGPFPCSLCSFQSPVSPVWQWVSCTWLPHPTPSLLVTMGAHSGFRKGPSPQGVAPLWAGWALLLAGAAPRRWLQGCWVTGEAPKARWTGRCRERPGGRAGGAGSPQSGPVRQGLVSNVVISDARWPLSEQHGDHRRQSCPHPLPTQLSAEAGKVGMGKVGMVPGQG